VQNLMAIGHTVAKIHRFFSFQNGELPSIMRAKLVKFLTLLTDIAIFRFS